MAAPAHAAPIVLPASLRFVERDWLSSNHLIARGASGNVIVDTGYCTRRELTLSLVDEALQGERLHRIVNTHTHSDHVGGNAALVARHGCRVEIPIGEREPIEQWREELLHYRTMGQACDRFTADGWYAAGDTLEFGDLDWQVIGSPGHDSDSLVLWQPRHRLLVCADALWAHGFGVQFPDFFGENAFDAQAETLDRIAALGAEIALPGHGPMFTDVAAAIERARGRLAYFVRHPERHARLALKVALSFMLLDRRRMPLETLARDWGELELVQRINARYFGEPTAALTTAIRDELVAAGGARVDDGALVALASAR
ncbi:MAG: MBL fold metallo-hydrolase [Lautropia sp.]